jgi:hypothetical protein
MKSKLLMVATIIYSISSYARGAEAVSAESRMFQEALTDPTMQYLVSESFSNISVAVGCSVLSLQWREGRIEGSEPASAGSPSVPLLMHGMAETSVYVLTNFPSGEVRELTQFALGMFEESQVFRERLMSICSSLMVPVLRYVRQKNNLSE